MTEVKVKGLKSRLGVYLTDDKRIHVPGLCRCRSIDVEGDVVIFMLDDTESAKGFGKRLVRYCESMGLSWDYKSEGVA